MQSQLRKLMDLLKNIILVIISPRVGWEEINQATIPTGRVLGSAFYPLLALLAVSSFVPGLYDSTLTLSALLMNAITLFAAYFFTYFISSYLLGGFYPELVKTKGAQERLDDYILYNLILLVLLRIIHNVLPGDFTPVLFLMLYMPWMAYRGVANLGIKEEKSAKFVVIASCLLLLTPFAIELLLGLIIK